MAQDALPTEFDVIVLGTGLPESIVASACARSGLSVLHLDSNDYYGSTWASFHLKSIGEWADEQMKDSNGTDGNPTADFSHHLLPGERLELVHPARRKVIKNVQHSWHVENAPQPPAAEVTEEKTTATVGEPNDSVEQSSTAAVESPTVPQETQSAPTDAKDPQTTTVPSAETAVPRWTRDRVEKDWRRFNLDLAPKVLRARGPMVQILCQSEVSRYAEFKCVDRFLCSGDHGNLHQVPCSRAEIFQTDAIGVMDKRRLMKFLTFAL
uniref:Uncharacterized protein n=1 Tax=Plectus sambesii TaxID=2011161 RepID=A0A914XGQ9_9BILA